MASNTSQGQKPKALHPRKKEPIGWDFRDVRAWQDPISADWCFIPWKNTEECNANDPDTHPTGGHAKLLYYTVGELKDEHRGSGIVVNTAMHEIIGCYRRHVDTEEGQEDKVEAQSLLKGEIPSLEGERKKIQSMPENQRTRAQNRRLTEIDEKEKSVRLAIKRCNGLVLDPRPERIARHEQTVLAIHPSVKEERYSKFGNFYLGLEDQWVPTMEDVLEIGDIPPFRVDRVTSLAETSEDLSRTESLIMEAVNEARGPD